MANGRNLDALRQQATATRRERTERQRDPTYREAYEDAQARERLVHTLRNLRLTANLTQADVAQRMGTTQSAVSDIEGADVDPHISTLQRYTRAVGAQLRLTCTTQRTAQPATLAATTIYFATFTATSLTAVVEDMQTPASASQWFAEPLSLAVH